MTNRLIPTPSGSISSSLTPAGTPLLPSWCARTWPRCSILKGTDAFYVLTPEQSAELMKRTPHLIGHDPIILVYDLFAPPDRTSRGYRGFRLNLGLIKHPEQALARLQEFLRFIAINRAVVPLDRAIRHELYRQGFDGMIKVLREASTELI